VSDRRLAQLERELTTIGDAYSGLCTWALTEVTSGESISCRADTIMPTASLIKVPILVALYQAAAEGKADLAARVSYGPEHRVLGSGVLSRMSPGVQMTVRDAATLMIIISDNSATNMCIDLLGIDYVNATMRSLGLVRTTLFRRLGDPDSGRDARNMSVSTAGEMTSLLARLARHELVNAEASEDMLRIMRRQDYRHELSAELPWNELNMLGDDPKVAWVAEKGGAFLNGVRCSGAIFKGPRGYFAMSAFCEGGTGPGTGRNAEGNITLGHLGHAAWEALAA